MSQGDLSEVLQRWAKVFTRSSMHQFKRTMDETGLSPSQLWALMRLYHHGECGLSLLSEHLGISRAAASQMTDRLVHLGLLARAENPADRRAKLLTLTPAGEAVVRRTIDARRKWMEDLTCALDADQRAIIADALQTLTEAAEQIQNE